MQTINYIKGAVCIFELTHRCNLQCRHCYITEGTNSNELSTDEVKYILDKIHYGGCTWVKFTGGEPLMRNDFAAIYTYAIRKMRVSVLTNATLITSKVIKLFSKYPPYNVEVSIYGSSEDTYRAFCNSGKAYSMALKGLDLLLRGGIDFEIKTPITRINKDEIPNIRDLALKYRCKFNYNTTLYPRIDGRWFSPAIRLSPSEVVGFDFDKDLRKNQPDAWLEMYTKFIHKKRPPFIYTCGVGSGYFSIDPFGNMSICHMFPRRPQYNLLQGSFQYGLKVLKRLSKERVNFQERCTRCKVYFLCNKCPAIDGSASAFCNYYCRIAELRWGKLKELYKNQRRLSNVS